MFACKGCVEVLERVGLVDRDVVSSTEDEERRKVEKPELTTDEAIAIAEKKFGLQVSAAKELESYDDRNFRLTVETPAGRTLYTLKVHNGVESDRPQELESQNAMLTTLHRAGIECPVPVASIQGGKETSFVELGFKGTDEESGGAGGAASAPSTKLFAVRLLTWVSGSAMNEATAEQQLALLPAAGEYLGRMWSVLADFDHEGAKRVHQWDLNNTGALATFTEHVHDEARRALVEGVIDDWRRTVSPAVRKRDHSKFRWGVIQSDFSATNIILNDDASAVHGVIDFGDSLHSLLVNDLAISLAYAVVEGARQAEQLADFSEDDALRIACAFYSGFCRSNSLLPDERRSLLLLMACRLAMSVTLGAYSFSKDPTNSYVLLYAEPGWKALSLLRSITVERFLSALDACGEIPTAD